MHGRIFKLFCKLCLGFFGESFYVTLHLLSEVVPICVLETRN